MNFRRKVLRVARRQYRRGLVTREDYAKVLKASHDPEIMAKWETEVEHQLGAPWKVSGAIDWAAIWKWFCENWLSILRILLTLLLFVAPEPASEEESSSESRAALKS